MEDLRGKQLGPYQIIEPLGDGGMATVFRAYQPGMDRLVAIKVLPRQLASKPEFIGRFYQEAQLLANLQHPHILPVFDFGESDGYTYIVMPFVESGTLADLLFDGHPLQLNQITQIISQVGDALDYAHEQGLIHRDIKPSNILVDKRGNCLLTDFGIAKIFEATSELTAPGGILGTPAYMSPEQGHGEKVDSRSDIYSLGIVLYEIVTGRVPFQAETPYAVIFKHIHDPLPLPRDINPDLPEKVEAVILKMLAKKPDDRYSTAGEMVQALQTAVTQSSQTTEPTQTEPQISPDESSYSNRELFVFALLLIFGMTGLGAILSRVFLSDDPIPPFPIASPTAEIESGTIVQLSRTPLPTLVFTSTPKPAPTTTIIPANTSTVPATVSSTMTADPSPTLTSTPTATTAVSCPPVSGLFAATWSGLQDRIGCSTSPIFSGLIVEENFESGKMIWREPVDSAQALVLFNNGTWQIFRHPPYVEGDPDYPCTDSNTPAQSPPTPRRGFGAMWCDIPAIRNGLGKAIDAERGFSGQMQDFDNGFMIYTDYDVIFIFYSGGIWEQR